MNKTRAAAFVAAALAGLWTIGSAGAQVVPPAPAKTPATPEYTPPPPPAPNAKPTPVQPTPNAKPAEAEKPLPSIVQKDEAGKIKPLKYPLDEAAVRALDLGEETTKKIEATLLARRPEIGRVVVEKLDDLMEVRRAIDESTEQTTLDTYTTVGKKAQPFRAFNNLLDRLVKDGLITVPQKSQAARVAREYKNAIGKELSESSGHTNVQVMMLAGFRLSVSEFTAEAFRELDNLLAESAPKAEELVKGMNLPDSHAASKRLADLKKPAPAGKTAAEHREAVVKEMFYKDLDKNERHAFLAAAHPKLLEKPAEPEKATQPNEKTGG